MWDEINTTPDFDLTDNTNQIEQLVVLSPISFPHHQLQSDYRQIGNIFLATFLNQIDSEFNISP